MLLLVMLCLAHKIPDRLVEEGLALAKAATLTRQLTRRFGPLPEWAVLRVQQAPPVELDAWLDRIFDAPTLQAALDGP